MHVSVNRDTHPIPSNPIHLVPLIAILFDGDERRRWREKEKEEPMLLRERPLLLSEWKLTGFGEDLNWIYLVVGSGHPDDLAIGSYWADAEIFVWIWTDKTVRHRCCECLTWQSHPHILCMQIKIKLFIGPRCPWGPIYGSWCNSLREDVET